MGPAVKRPDELELWAAVKEGETPRAAGARLGIHPKRVRRLCQKWARKGIFTVGVSADLGTINKYVAGPIFGLEQDADGQWVYHELQGPGVRYAGLR